MGLRPFGKGCSVVSDEGLDFWHNITEDVIKCMVNADAIDENGIVNLDIKDALFLQWQLAGAIDDYTKAVGK